MLEKLIIKQNPDGDYDLEDQDEHYLADADSLADIVEKAELFAKEHNIRQILIVLKEL